MKISLVPARLLGREHIERWCALQASDRSLSSPFLSPEFAIAVSAVRDDVEVGILERDRTAVGFFPFQRSRFSRGRPVGFALNDMQAVVTEPGTEWDCLALVRGCRLVEFEFSRLLGSQLPFERFHYQRRRYAFIDLSRGYESYAREQRRAGRRVVQHVEALARRLERDVGPLRCDIQSSDTAALSMLMKWKFERYRAHGYVDIFAIPWVRGLMHQVHATRTERFSGVLSLLYAGEELAAAHLGMRCLREYHYWYHAYNPRFARYSPGLTLLLRVARHADDLGVERIALGGCDEYGYKQDLMNSSIGVLEGSVSRIPGVAAARRWRHAGARTIRESSVLRPPARALLRAYRRVKHNLLYEHADHERGRNSSAAQD